MLDNKNALNALQRAARTVEGRVYVYREDGTLAHTFRHDDILKEFTVERTGDNSKFFGYGVAHKANIKVIDKERKLSLNTSNKMYPYFVNRSTGTPSSVFPYPYMDITEVNRDENTNALSITCYDRLHKAAAHKVSELTIAAPYTMKQFVNECANLLGLTGALLINITDEEFALSYEEGANFEGTETIRDALNAAAEATQSIYYIDKNNKLVFKRLDMNGNAALTIRKDDYINLDSKTNRRLAKIVSATELGDNIAVELEESGTTQYIRNNPFWDLREDRTDLLENALAAIGGFTINQFECDWRGNYLLEIGDKIDFVLKDDSVATSYLLDDTLTYNGFLSQKTKWEYIENENETADNPTSLGELINQTFAKVDKANKQVTILASEVSDKVEAIAQLQLDTEKIFASVQRIEDTTNANTESLNEEISTINKKLDATITPEEVELKIQSEVTNGVEKVVTSTGYRLDNEGLTIDRSDSPMKTTVSEDGVAVQRDGTEVLIANNEGVKAEDLHATTYLIIGNTSRFEDYTINNKKRTGCFWIGGDN